MLKIFRDNSCFIMRHNGEEMEILLLFILNIFTGALIYLLLSLKIERNSSTFHEKKLKKEMGEIITEFNSTAERNITLLEARISVLKKLMAENGSLKTMDITMDHNPRIEKTVNDSVDTRSKIKRSVSIDRATPGGTIITKNAADIAEISFTGAADEKKPVPGKSFEHPALKPAAASKDESKKSTIHAGVFTEDSSGLKPGVVSRGGQVDFVSNEDIGIVPEEPEIIQFENPADLFLSAENKYSLIAELHGRGYSVEDLAAYSGLPAGEVRLVISLNR